MIGQVFRMGQPEFRLGRGGRAKSTPGTLLVAICPGTLATLVLGDLFSAFFLKISHVIQ